MDFLRGECPVLLDQYRESVQTIINVIFDRDISLKQIIDNSRDVVGKPDSFAPKPLYLIGSGIFSAFVAPGHGESIIVEKK